MRTLQLIRVALTDKATYGVLLHDGIPFAVTLERPWLNNQQSISCIPVGTYTCLRCSASPDYGYKDSPKFGNTFQVYAVPGRGNILFHKGNLEDDTHGCILVGEAFNPVKGKLGITSSKEGFAEFFMLLTGVDEFTLVIKEVT